MIDDRSPWLPLIILKLARTARLAQWRQERCSAFSIGTEPVPASLTCAPSSQTYHVYCENWDAMVPNAWPITRRYGTSVWIWRTVGTVMSGLSLELMLKVEALLFGGYITCTTLLCDYLQLLSIDFQQKTINHFIIFHVTNNEIRWLITWIILVSISVGFCTEAWILRK